MNNSNNMDLKAEKLFIIERFKQINDASLIGAIKGLLDYAQKTSSRISIEKYNKELDEAETEITQGKGISHNDLKNDIEKW